VVQLIKLTLDDSALKNGFTKEVDFSPFPLRFRFWLNRSRTVAQSFCRS